MLIIDHERMLIIQGSDGSEPEMEPVDSGLFVGAR